jgi:hypothetical protein
MDDTTFWLVWSPQGIGPPRYRHPSERQAQTEAERLAREHPSAEFYVLHAISCSKVTTVETARLWREPVPDLPPAADPAEEHGPPPEVPPEELLASDVPAPVDVPPDAATRDPLTDDNIPF